MKSNQIEIAVVNLFDPRRNIIVPRITGGYNKPFNHECDLLILSGSGYATEVEIKTSVSDLKKDFTKTHGHDSPYIRRLYYAMPAAMQGHSALNLIPERCGIVFVHEIPANQFHRGRFVASINRKAKSKCECKKFNDADVYYLLRNVHIKYWSMILKKTYSHE